jgi:CO/xanthine dehydrogenase Mo-binding subunit
VDGHAKVTGQKLYARDFRACDMPGWPAVERAAMVVRATQTDRAFESLDLSRLPQQLQPINVVDAACLARDGIKLPYAETSPQGRPGGIMVAEGQAALYFGQPLAILIFADAKSLRAARRLIQFDPATVRYGPPLQPPAEAPPYSPPTYLTRYAEGGQELFSQVLDGPSNPYQPDQGDPQQQKVNKAARQYREKIQQQLADSSWRQFQQQVQTQRLDPLFLEPEAGLGWLDKQQQAMHLVLGTQATDGDFQDGLAMFAEKGCPVKVRTVYLTSCYPGGGFGGRDESPFAPLLTVAAAYSDGPVRMAYDRYEQFQAGLKRAGATLDQTLAVDEQGLFQALLADYRFEAGGKNNYSQFVAELGAYSAAGAYRVSRAAVDAVAQPTNGVVAGSMRGFGGPAACFAMETLVDSAAEQLGIDAIELRRRNVLAQGDRSVTGAPLSQPLGLASICERAAATALWQQRKTLPPSRAGHLRGVGFALANQAYGTGSDGVMARVELGADGRLVVSTNCVDMGNGSATTLALATAPRLGRNADDVRMGDVAAFTVLRAQLSNHPAQPTAHRKAHAAERPAASVQQPWDNPNYTAAFSMSSSACLTAFHQVHAVRQAADVLFTTGVWPAACGLWGIDPGDGRLQQAAAWADGGLQLPGFAALSWPQLDAQMASQGLNNAAMVHAYFAGQWVSASYPVNGREYRWQVDGLAVRAAGASEFQFIPRHGTQPPPDGAQHYGRSLYAPSATLAAVEIDPATGAVAVTEVHSFLDAGPVLQPELLSGQYQGAVAMGVGSALLEYLPLGAEGAGKGDWNLDRYHPALASDLPLERIRLELIPPGSPDEPSRGIAEAVLSPLAPAICNAVAAATGYRCQQLPIKAADVLSALHNGSEPA